MVKKGYTPEQIINKLREAEIMLSQGAALSVVLKRIGVSDATYYRWRKEYGGMRVERRACRVIGQARGTQRYEPSPPCDEKRLTEEITKLATKYGRYGYRRITALLNNKMGWRVNHKRVARIWRREGLKVPKKQPRRGRLWLNDGSCI